jgi:hypothetical protein
MPGEQLYINKSADNADVAVIWSVLWRGRMEQYKKIWDRYRSQGKPVVVEVGGLRRNKSFKIGINGINRDADFANQELRRPTVANCSNTSYDLGIPQANS